MPCLLASKPVKGEYGRFKTKNGDSREPASPRALRCNTLISDPRCLLADVAFKSPRARRAPDLRAVLHRGRAGPTSMNSPEVCWQASQ